MNCRAIPCRSKYLNSLYVDGRLRGSVCPSVGGFPLYLVRPVGVLYGVPVGQPERGRALLAPVGVLPLLHAPVRLAEAGRAAGLALPEHHLKENRGGSRLKYGRSRNT